MAAKGGSGKTGKQKERDAPSPEAIINKFQQMRSEQRDIASKMGELVSDRREHSLVIETLKGVSSDRRCFRMVGGVLMERTVKEVLPDLVNNCEQMGVMVERLKGQLEEKGKEINAFREKHNIRIHGEPADTKPDPNPDQSRSGAQSSGILVS